MEAQLKKLNNQPQYRRAYFQTRGVIDEKERIIELSFSSEEPVPRDYGYEVLSHETAHVRLGRLNDGAPVLVDHDRKIQIGVVLSAEIREGRGIARIKLSRNALGTEYFNDVQDGIRTKISVGYWVHDMKRMQSSSKDDKQSYVALDWEPFEITFVSVPADNSVGVGRSADIDEKEEPTPPIENENNVNLKEKEMETPQIEVEKVDIEKLQRQAVENANKRAADILEIGTKYGNTALAIEFAKNGKSVNEFRAALLEAKHGEPSLPIVQKPAAEIGMTHKEAKRFSILKAMNACADKDWSNAEFEREACQEVARVTGKSPQGFFLPFEVQTRELTVGSATAGGNLVATNLKAESFIEILRNSMVTRQLGATVLGDLVGDIAIPRETALPTLEWLAENGEASGSNPTVDQITLTPKSASCNTTFSRKLLLQSSIDVENWVSRTLALAVGLGTDSAVFNGTGASNQPTGIRATSGVNSIVTGTDGSAPTWANIVLMESEVDSDNAAMGSLAYVLNAKTCGKLKTTEKATNTAKFILEGNEINGHRFAKTNQLPSNLTKGSSGATLSSMIFGNFNDVIIGEWGALDILVDPYSESKKGKVTVVIFKEMDLAVRHPESFTVFDNLITV